MEENIEISYHQFKKKRPKWTKRWRRSLEFYLLKLLIALGQKISLEKLQMMGRALGHLAYYVLKKDKGIIIQQLSMVFPDLNELDRERWARQCFLHFGQFIFEMVGLSHIEKQFEERVTITGEEYLEEGLKKGKGVILVVPHLGNWEVFGPYFLKKGYPVNAIMKPMYDDRHNEIILNIRQRGAITMIPRGVPDSAKRILHCFKQNEIFFVLIDQDTDVPSIFAPFFGIPAQTPIIASNLALKTGAALLGGTVYREPQGKFRISFSPIGSFLNKKPNEEDIYALTEKLNQNMEKLILRDPPQWSWFHRRWKHRP